MNFSIDHGFGGIGAWLVLLAIPAALYMGWLFISSANAAHKDVEGDGDDDDTGTFEVVPPDHNDRS